MPDKSMTIFEHIAPKVAPAEAIMFLTFLGICILGVAAFVHWMIPENFRNKWWYFATGIVTLLAIILLAHLDIEKLDQLGGFLAGVFSPIAIIWFVAAYKQQNEELHMQWKELIIQREAIQQQTKEWTELKKFSAMEKTENILKKFETTYQSANKKTTLFDLPGELESLIEQCDTYKPEPEPYFNPWSHPWHVLYRKIQRSNEYIERYHTALLFYQDTCNILIFNKHHTDRYKSIIYANKESTNFIIHYSQLALNLAKTITQNGHKFKKFELECLQHKTPLSDEERMKLMELSLELEQFNHDAPPK